MAKFHDVECALTTLEQRQFDSIRKAFCWPEELKPHIRGSIQCYAVDKPKDADLRSLPVICAVGINYTQNGRCSTDELFRYEESSVGVVRSTAVHRGRRFRRSCLRAKPECLDVTQAGRSRKPFGFLWVTLCYKQNWVHRQGRLYFNHDEHLPIHHDDGMGKAASICISTASGGKQRPSAPRRPLRRAWRIG